MREKGFEIFIGDQSAPGFWQDFFAEVGDVDIIVDDGGHTNKNQIITVECCIDHIKDGGVLLIEDVGTSYLPEYGNPSRFSFVNYSKGLVDRLQLRGPLVRTRPPDKFTKSVYSISFLNRSYAFFVDRRLCGPSKVVHAGYEDIGSQNRWNEDKRLVGFETGRRGRENLRKLPTQSRMLSSLAMRGSAPLYLDASSYLKIVLYDNSFNSNVICVKLRRPRRYNH